MPRKTWKATAKCPQDHQELRIPKSSTERGPAPALPQQGQISCVTPLVVSQEDWMSAHLRVEACHSKTTSQDPDAGEANQQRSASHRVLDFGQPALQKLEGTGSEDRVAKVGAFFGLWGWLRLAVRLPHNPGSHLH